MNPAFVLIARRERVNEVFSALARTTDSTNRSRLSVHLPWNAAKSLSVGSRTVEVGVKGWHGWAQDWFNCHSFGVKLRDALVACDLSIYAGATWVLVELRAANNDAADAFSEDSRRGSLADSFAPVVELVCYDNESDGWRLVYPRDREFAIPWTQDDLSQYLVPGSDSDPAIDVDELGQILMEMASVG